MKINKNGYIFLINNYHNKVNSVFNTKIMKSIIFILIYEKIKFIFAYNNKNL